MERGNTLLDSGPSFFILRWAPIPTAGLSWPRVNSAGLCKGNCVSWRRSCSLLLQPPALVPPGQLLRPGVAAFGFRREGHKAFKNKRQEIKKGLQSWLQGRGGTAALALSFQLEAPCPSNAPTSPRGSWHLCHLGPRVTGKGPPRAFFPAPGWPSEAPLRLAPASVEGASSPSSAATGNAEPGGQGPAGSSSRGGQAAQRWGLYHAGACEPERRGGRQSYGRGGRGPGFSCLCDYQTPKKGKGLGKLVVFGQAPASICLRLSSRGMHPWGRAQLLPQGKRASSSTGG